MPIEFHCDHCGKTVRAPDEAAGKRGKCPACHQSVYIPTPSNLLEPLPLAPVDEREERERERLLREERELRRRLLREREAPQDTPPPPASSDVLMPRVDMETLVVEYAICMFAGHLEEAEELATDIRRNMQEAEEIMERITVDEIPPAQLNHIPRPVLVGYFKRLREKK